MEAQECQSGVAPQWLVSRSSSFSKIGRRELRGCKPKASTRPQRAAQLRLCWCWSHSIEIQASKLWVSEDLMPSQWGVGRKFIFATGIPWKCSKNRGSSKPIGAKLLLALVDDLRFQHW